MKLEQGSIATDWTPAPEDTDSAIAGIEIGGVNLVRDSETFTLVADSADTYWIAADELEPGNTYTLSVREVVLEKGQAAGVTWKVLKPHDRGDSHLRPARLHLWQAECPRSPCLIRMATGRCFCMRGVSGATTGVTVVFRKIKLEEGSIATSWQASPEETSEALGQLTEAVEGLDGGLDERVQGVIDALGVV